MTVSGFCLGIGKTKKAYQTKLLISAKIYDHLYVSCCPE